MRWVRRIPAPLLLLFIPVLFPGLVVIPALLDKAANSIGIVVRHEQPQEAVQIVRVAPHSPAEHAGIKSGMKLLGAMGQPVRNLKDIDRIWAKRQPSELLAVEVQEGNAPPVTLHINPGITPDFTPILLNVLGGFYFLGLISLLLPQWRSPQARVLILMLVLLSTDFILPYNYDGQWEAWLWRFNLFNLIVVNLLILHFFLLFPRPAQFFQSYRKPVFALLYGLLLPTGFYLAAGVENPSDNQSSYPVYRMDTLLAMSSWLMLSLRALSLNQEPERTLARWVWLFFTPFAFAKLFWYMQTYQDLSWPLPVDSLVQGATILAPTGIFLAVARLDYLQAGKRLRNHDLGLFLLLVLLLLVLLLAHQVYTAVLDIQPALATLAAVILALTGGVLTVPLSERLRNWLVRGIFARPDRIRQAIERFFSQQMNARDESQLLEAATQFIQEQFRLPWAGIHFSAGLEERDELITISQPSPFDAKTFTEFLQGLDQCLTAQSLPKYPRKEKLREWMEQYQIAHCLSFETGTHSVGQILVGQSPHQARALTTHELKDLRLIMERLALLLERIQLEKTAEMDSLTGVLRREAGMIRLQLELENTLKKQRPLSLALLDLDHFKQINDAHGHLVGDQVLKETAKLIRRHLRQSDFVCRYGGEEFLVVFPGTGLKGAETAMNKLLRAIRRHYISYGKGDKSLHITISGGCCTLPGGFEETEPAQLATRMIQQADNLLYKAKREGRNRAFCQPFKPGPESDWLPHQ